MAFKMRRSGMQLRSTTRVAPQLTKYQSSSPLHQADITVRGTGDDQVDIQGVVVNDTTKDPLMEPVRSQMKQRGLNSIFVIPIIKKDSVIGTLFLGTATELQSGISDRVYKLCHLVANISAIKNGDWTAIADEINHILPIIRSKGKVIKIIIESGVLTHEEIIACCDIYGAAGIDYLKTSTGYAEKGASVEAVQLFRKHLPESVHIKASGGIRDYETAKQMIEAGATRIGCSAGVAIVSGAKTDQVKSNY